MGVGPSRTPVEGGVATRANGNDDHSDDLDPEKGKGDSEFGYRREGVRGGVVALGVVAVLLLIFVLQNDEKGSVDFLFWHFQVQTWFALLITAVLGFIGGYLVCWLRRRRRLARDG